MKNILLIVPRLNIGGAETYTAMVAENLQQRGYTVYTASGGGMLADKLSQKGIPNFWLPIRFSTSLSAFMLKHIIKKYNINLVHANSAAAGITALKFKQRYKDIPVIFTAHGVLNNNHKEFILNDCDKIICVSKFLQNDCLQKGFNKNKLITIYTGINKDKFNNQIDGSIIRQQLNISQDAFVLSLVARIKNLTNKGHLDMLNILKNHTEANNWHLIVIGKGKSLHKLKSMIKDYQLERQIHCVGHQLDVAKYVAASDVIVLPSYFETFGLALAEGMAMGKPGITYNIGGCPEVVQNNKTGFVVDYKNEEAFFQKLLLLYKDKNLYNQMATAAETDIKKRLSCDKMMDELEHLYNEYINK